MKTYAIVKAKINKFLIGEKLSLEVVKKRSKSAKTRQQISTKYVLKEEFNIFKNEFNTFKNEMNEFKKVVNDKFDNIDNKFDILFKHLGIN